MAYYDLVRQTGLVHWLSGPLEYWQPAHFEEMVTAVRAIGPLGEQCGLVPGHERYVWAVEANSVSIFPRFSLYTPDHLVLRRGAT